MATPQREFVLQIGRAVVELISAQPGVYSIADIADALHRIGDSFDAVAAEQAERRRPEGAVLH